LFFAKKCTVRKNTLFVVRYSLLALSLLFELRLTLREKVWGAVLHSIVSKSRFPEQETQFAPLHLDLMSHR